MRVVSLLPAATEVVASIGGAGLLVGVSHECDFPPQVSALPRVTSTRLDRRLASGEIDAQMALATLARLRPDVLIGQSLCDVCAVSGPELERVVTSLQPTPWVVTLHPHTLAEALVDIWRVGEVIGFPDEAEEVVAGWG